MLRKFLTLLFLVFGISAFAQPYRNEWIDYSKTYYKFGLKDEGLYRISKTVLDNLNIGTVNAEDFQLWKDGVEQPIYTSQATGPLLTGGYIEFYGKPLDGNLDTELFPNPDNHVFKDLSLFSDSSYYFLTVNPGRSNSRFTPEINLAATSTLLPDSFFVHTTSINFFRGGFQFNYNYGYGIAPLPSPSQIVIRSSVYDAGEGFASTPFDGNKSLTIAFNSMQAYLKGPLQTMSLKYGLAGAWSFNRNIDIALNDSSLAKVYIPGFQLRKGEIKDIPLSRITNDAMTAKFSSDQLTYPEKTQVNALYLSYPRKFHFGNTKVFSFQLPANSNGNLIKSNGLSFGSQPPLMLDLTNKKRYVGITKADSSFFALSPSSTDRKLVIVNQADYLKQVTVIAKVNFTDFSQVSNQGDYLIITSKRVSFDSAGIDQAVAYRDYRSSTAGGSFKAKVIDVEELYDQYAYGIRKHPLGIKHFIQSAVSNFAVKPRFVVFIGRGVEYLNDRYSGNYTGRELLNAVPSYGAPCSDNLLASGNNLDPTPLVPIGRISIINGNELANYLQKVKEYELINASPDFTPEQKEWKKEVVQLVGGDDSFFSSVLYNFMQGYKKIIADTLVGANVKTYVKADNPNFPKEIKEISDRISNGAGLVNYFGHSSVSSIDFNLGSPDDYTNSNGKYPVIIANGCQAGNLFSYNRNRLYYYGQSISERFILSKEKGAIAFVSNSDYGLYNYLNIFTQEWMKSAAKTNYGYGVGEIQRNAIKNTMAITGTGEFYNRLNLEQCILHADPAVIIFPNDKPDYTITDSLLTVTPTAPTVAEDSIWIKAKFLNIGKSIKDSVWAEIKREFPDGRDLTIATQLFRNLKNGDSIAIKIPVKGIFDQGTNYIVATIDYPNGWNEMSETNNSVRIPFEVIDEEIRPVFPYRYSIMNAPGFHMTGSSVNAVQGERTYRIQVDTTEFFNSPLLYTQDTTSLGGAVDFLPNISWTNGRVYYWRLAPVINGIAINWQKSSFQFLQGLYPGWGQSHFYQHLKSQYVSSLLDSTSRKFKFDNNLQNLYVVNSVYGYSGGADNDFSIQENGTTNIYSACVGHSIIFNVFDTLTFKPWTNLNQAYGSGAYCAVGRQYNFEFSYYPASNRKKIMDFLDSIPKGMIVTARLILDPPHDSSFVKYWMKDTLLFGPGKSLYHSLLKQGFKEIDSLYKPRTWSFVFRKDDTLNLKPSSKISIGLYDRLDKSYFITTVDSVGEILSPVFGPAKTWREMHWLGHQPEDIVDDSYAAVQLIGIDKDSNTTVLKTYAPGEWDNDISFVDAATYPNLQLKLLTGNKMAAKPYQLDFWRLFYDPAPDGALSAKDYYEFNKPVLGANDTLKIDLAFKNVSETYLDSCSVRITIGDREGHTTVYVLDKLRPLTPGDTAIINFTLPVFGMDGKYYAYIEVNPDQSPLEQNTFNNSTYIPFEVITILPVSKIDLNAISQQTNVRLNWLVTNEHDVASYVLEHSGDDKQFSPISTFAPKNTSAATTPYEYLHISPLIGANYYRVKVTSSNGEVSYSAIRQVNFTRSGAVIIYPNPFGSRLAIASPGNQSWRVELFTANGQKLISQTGSGSANIDTHLLPTGVYMAKLTYNNKTTTIKLEKRN